MSAVEASTGHATHNTDCLVCREWADIDDFDGDAHRRWARRHVERNPGHEVHVERSIVRSYRSEVSS